MSRSKREQQVEFFCIGGCDQRGEDPPVWMVEGRFNAMGLFEFDDEQHLYCPDCGDPGEPTDTDVVVA